MSVRTAAFFASLALVLATQTTAAPNREVAPAAPRVEPAMVDRARRAFTAWLDAAERGDSTAARAVLTRDAAVEYVTRGPGVYSDADGMSLGAECVRDAARLQLRRRFAIEWLSYAGTGDEIFVEYRVAVRAPGATAERVQPQLAMLVMRGPRIARIRSFGYRCTATPLF